MGNINRVPLGLLSLLDSQTQGQAPSQMGETVQPVASLSGLWLNARGLETVFSFVTAQKLSGQVINAPVVPEGEIWAVVLASARAYATDVAPNLQSVELTFLNAPLTTNTLTLASATPIAAPSGSVVSASARWPTDTPFWCAAGSRFGAYFNNLTAAAFVVGSVVEVSAAFYRLRI